MSFLTGIQTAFFKPQRQLGPIIAQVTLEELHDDELQITEHPVEQGAAISDHAYKRPAAVSLRCGWSNSGLPALSSNADTIFNFLNSGQIESFNYTQTIYDKLLKLQESRIPFDIVTGKRKYKNMLIRALRVTTDQATEHALFVSIECREVIIVQTTFALVPPREVQQFPEQTAATENRGTIQPVPKSTSVLQSLFGQ